VRAGIEIWIPRAIIEILLRLILSIKSISGSIVSDETIKKFVVTALVLASFAVWMLFGQASPSCAGHCVTDISAQRR
jgi:hypothetical protein